MRQQQPGKTEPHLEKKKEGKDKKERMARKGLGCGGGGGAYEEALFRQGAGPSLRTPAAGKGSTAREGLRWQTFRPGTSASSQGPEWVVEILAELPFTPPVPCRLLPEILNLRLGLEPMCPDSNPA